MASLPALQRSQQQNAFQIQTVQHNALSKHLAKNKWTMLIADKLTYQGKQDYALRVKKPDSALLVIWLEKLICAGQFSNIYVEDLALDEINTKRFQTLCAVHDVNLVNLIVASTKDSNLVLGPWRQNSVNA